MEIPAGYMMEHLPQGLGAGFFILFHDMWEWARLDVLMSSHLGGNGQKVRCSLAAIPIVRHWSWWCKESCGEEVQLVGWWISFLCIHEALAVQPYVSILGLCHSTSR